MNPTTPRLLQSLAAALLFTATTQAATITHQITHHWATNYWEFIPTIAVPGIPPFNPALGTLTQVEFSIVGERRTEWAAIAGGDGGSYTLGAFAQFLLNAPEKSGLPTRTLAYFITPEQWASGWLFGGQTTNGTLVSLASSNGIVTSELERFTQPGQYFLLSNGAADAGAVGQGGGAGFSSIVRYATATVTITYEYDPIVPPSLMITPAGAGQVMVSWTPTTPGFVLQESWSFATPNWTNAPSGASNPITIPVAGGARFYRLSKP